MSARGARDGLPAGAVRVAIEAFDAQIAFRI
jgi:hypothetical protein